MEKDFFPHYIYKIYSNVNSGSQKDKTHLKAQQVIGAPLKIIEVLFGNKYAIMQILLKATSCLKNVFIVSTKQAASKTTAVETTAPEISEF